MTAAYTDSEGARVGNAPDSGNAGDERPVQPTVPSDAPSAATKLDEKRPPCRCEPWAQRWRSDHPEVCVNCGGLFAARTVPARRLIRGR